MEYKISGKISGVKRLSGEIKKSTADTSDYSALMHKPKIEGIELNGNKSFKDLGLSALSNLEIINIMKGFE